MAPLQRHLGGGFVSVASLAIWGIGLVIFIRQPLVTLVTDVVLRSEATGFMGITPNKVCGRLFVGLGFDWDGCVCALSNCRPCGLCWQGGIVARLSFAGTRLCFVSSHLAAHLPHFDARNSNVRAVLLHADARQTTFIPLPLPCY